MMSKSDSSLVCLYLDVDDICEEVEVEEQDHTNIHVYTHPPLMSRLSILSILADYG